MNYMNDGYAPAQYQLYKMGEGEEWLEKALMGGYLDLPEILKLQTFYKDCSTSINAQSTILRFRAKNGGAKELQQLKNGKQAIEKYAQKGRMLCQGLEEGLKKKETDSNYLPDGYKKGNDKEAEECIASCRAMQAQIELAYVAFSSIVQEIESLQK